MNFKKFLLEAGEWWPDAPKDAVYFLGRLLDKLEVEIDNDGHRFQAKIEGGNRFGLYFKEIRGGTLLNLRGLLLNRISNIKLLSSKQRVIKNLLDIIKTHADKAINPGDANLTQTDISDINMCLEKLGLADEPDVKKALDWFKKNMPQE